MSDNPAASGFALKHEIFVLDAHLEEALDETQHESITLHLINKLLETLGMEPLGDLQIYPAVDMRAPGWSFIQPITTSHISGHYFEKPGRAPHIRMDIYSCCSVDWKKIITVVHSQIKFSDWRATFLVRNIEQDGNRHTLDIKGFGDLVLSQTTIGSNLSQITDTVKRQHLVKTAV